MMMFSVARLSLFLFLASPFATNVCVVGYAPNSIILHPRHHVRTSLPRPSFLPLLPTALSMYTDEPSAGPGGSRRSAADTNNDSEDDESSASQRIFLDEYGHPIEEKRIDYAGAGTLGDIMSSDEGYRGVVGGRTDESPVAPAVPKVDYKIISDTPKGTTSTADEGLVTTAGGTLQARFGTKVPAMSPLERIALTSNGNLQRIFSSYYDAPVHVHVDRCEMRDDEDEEESTMVGGEANGAPATTTPLLDIDFINGGNINGENGESINGEGAAVWDRTVHLSVHNQRFCTAQSVVTVRSPDCIRLVHSGAAGIGQLFRYLDRLPTFSLLDAGRTDRGGMWRLYTLECEELSCVIREEFAADAWSIMPSP